MSAAIRHAFPAAVMLAGLLGGCDDGRAVGNATRLAASRDRIVLTASDRRTLPAEWQQLGVRSLLSVKGPLRYGQFVWRDGGVAGGRAWIGIDLKRQLLSVFRGGDEIGTAVILYGADGLPTPRGRFPILAKLRDHRSSIYDAVMPYTLRLTGDGVSIHGSNVRRGAATHGCVGVPTAFAQRLFAVVRRGDAVVIS